MAEECDGGTRRRSATEGHDMREERDGAARETRAMSFWAGGGGGSELNAPNKFFRKFSHARKVARTAPAPTGSAKRDPRERHGARAGPKRVRNRRFAKQLKFT